MSGNLQAIVERVLNANIEDVYDAWTDPKLFAQWITEGGTIEKADIRVGGEFLIMMGCGNDKFSPHGGVYLVLQRPHIIEFTWLSDWTSGESIVRIELSAEGELTRFKLVHTGLPDQANADDHQAGWTEFADKSAAIANTLR
jgi:uncharacterized protein YndB with AHSA1/START domain